MWFVVGDGCVVFGNFGAMIQKRWCPLSDSQIVFEFLKLQSWKNSLQLCWRNASLSSIILSASLEVFVINALARKRFQLALLEPVASEHTTRDLVRRSSLFLIDRSLTESQSHGPRSQDCSHGQSALLSRRSEVITGPTGLKGRRVTAASASL